MFDWFKKPHETSDDGSSTSENDFRSDTEHSGRQNRVDDGSRIQDGSAGDEGRGQDAPTARTPRDNHVTGEQDESLSADKETMLIEPVHTGEHATLTRRFEATGYVLPSVPAPVAAYVPARYVGPCVDGERTIQTSGQLPFVDGELVRSGKVGNGQDDVPVGYAYQLAKVCALNAFAAAVDVAGDMDRISGVEKVTVFVASHSDFTAQAQVANGASDFFGELFDEGHARSAVGVAVLPLDAPVEVEVIFRVRS